MPNSRPGFHKSLFMRWTTVPNHSNFSPWPEFWEPFQICDRHILVTLARFVMDHLQGLILHGHRQTASEFPLANVTRALCNDPHGKPFTGYRLCPLL
jgi:hypothetical protein